MAGKKKQVLVPGEFDSMCAEKAAREKGKTPPFGEEHEKGLREYLDEYLDKVGEHAAREPEHLPDEVWDEAMRSLKETGKLPAKYRDKFTVNEFTDEATGETLTGLYETEWEKWKAERLDIDKEYETVLRAAILEALASLPKDVRESGDPDAISSYLVTPLLEKLATRALAPTAAVEVVEKTDFPLDKVNAQVWRLLEEAREGQLAFNVAVESEEDKRAGKEINILYGIEFGEIEEAENVKITRKLEPYDKRVYIAVGAIFKAGYDYMSYQQIYNAMRFKGRAGASDLRKIHAAISKMSGAKIYVDNLEEANVYNYGHFRYDGSLLPMERATAIVNGQLAESVIHVFREPPLLTLARERRQITTIERRLLASPLSMTNANIKLEDYLIDRISHMKNGTAQRKMLFETIYRNAGIKTIKQKQRAWGKIKKLLEHYKACGWIAGYTKEKNGVRINL